MSPGPLKPYKGVYQKDNPAPYMLSRSKIEDFVRCPLCFVLDRKFKISRPSTPSFPLNSAVDALLKKEFDHHRLMQTVHPALVELGQEFVPLQHPEIDNWRNNFVGVSHLHPDSNFHLYGAVDDIWTDKQGNLVVVDYKATAKSEPVTALSNEEWHMAYRRQLDFYQWLLVQNGYSVSEKGYWLYATARNTAESFKNRLDFDIRLIEHQGDISWVGPTALAAKTALDLDQIPDPNPKCEFCEYALKRSEVLPGNLHKSQ